MLRIILLPHATLPATRPNSCISFEIERRHFTKRADNDRKETSFVSSRPPSMNQVATSTFNCAFCTKIRKLQSAFPPASFGECLLVNEDGGHVSSGEKALEARPSCS